jgi:hypothetical protein
MPVFCDERDCLFGKSGELAGSTAVPPSGAARSDRRGGDAQFACAA